MIIEYKNKSGVYIIKIKENKYYYGNGENINAIGISANQFLRFNPYMEKTHITDIPNKIKDNIIKMIDDE